ncbi:hypothetical protein D8674_011656 [Pyrus ussuriensis x Pyrus communis]|uniref:Uncharacterized protein n=1 Tax=Pyrus ussuriensis x Pyrus communis TaxID=2448454 RepID=A0A5N5FZC9_9ROSA|nr:hypothetical protein D8674_011656 [Pyrus ussuriensis x Pyrus communis]
MVMASNSDEYVVVGRLRYVEFWDNGISQALSEGEADGGKCGWKRRSRLFPRPRLLVEKAIQTLSKDEVAGGKGSDDVEDMFVDNVGMHIGHGGVDVSKRNSKHVNENDIGNEDDGVLESCCGKFN